MLWNPRNVYTTNDIKPDPPDAKVQATDKAHDVKATDAKPTDAKSPTTRCRCCASSVGLICQAVVACATATTPASAAPPGNPSAASSGQTAEAIGAIMREEIAAGHLIGGVVAWASATASWCARPTAIAR